MQFLSPEWIAAADLAVKNAAASAPVDGLIIDQRVAGALDYRIVLGPNPSVQEHTEQHQVQPSAVFSQDIATATAVATGETDSHQAFLLGQIQFEGDISLLIERRDAFDWLESALAPVLAKTTFA